jgi:hypothetical protein
MSNVRLEFDLKKLLYLKKKEDFLAFKKALDFQTTLYFHFLYFCMWLDNQWINFIFIFENFKCRALF